MPLLDHFHPPDSDAVLWTTLHHVWASALADDLNQLLPPRYYADPSVRLGIEVDVAALERIKDAAAHGEGAAWSPPWEPPAATATLPFAVATDEIEVLIRSDFTGEWRLVGAVEFVSPANKDRSETRRAFAAKCQTYLLQGAGVVIVDVATTPQFSLHDELIDLLERDGPRSGSPTAVSAYRPTGKNGTGQLSVWLYPLGVGQDLPTVPLWLNGGICVPARLEQTYQDAGRRLRLAERLEFVRRPRPAGG